MVRRISFNENDAELVLDCLEQIEQEDEELLDEHWKLIERLRNFLDRDRL